MLCHGNDSWTGNVEAEPHDTLLGLSVSNCGMALLAVVSPHGAGYRSSSYRLHLPQAGRTGRELPGRPGAPRSDFSVLMEQVGVARGLALSGNRERDPASRRELWGAQQIIVGMSEDKPLILFILGCTPEEQEKG
jgi:hypothetical protein